jgi:hypothetical protein
MAGLLRRARWFLALAPALVLALGMTGAALAESPAAPLASEAQLAAARLHFEQGVELYEKAYYASALTEFQTAYDAAQAATILYNIGLTYKALRRYPEAIDSLERYLGNAAKDGQLKADRRRQVGQLIEEMKGQLSPVTFALSPAEAQLKVDGQVVTLPKHGTMPVASGPHVAQVTAEGYEPQQREFIVSSAPVVLAFDLSRKRQSAKLRLTSNQPGTSVEIDGQERGLAPLELELPPGARQMFAHRPGFETYRTEVMLEPGQERTLNLMLFPARERSTPVYTRWWFWTGVGAAILGGTAAALLLRPGDQAPLGGTLGPSVSVGVTGR